VGEYASPPPFDAATNGSHRAPAFAASHRRSDDRDATQLDTPSVASTAASTEVGHSIQTTAIAL
jgi:hypothetical protein